jgi:hypothetical protein
LENFTVIVAVELSLPFKRSEPVHEDTPWAAQLTWVALIDRLSGVVKELELLSLTANPALKPCGVTVYVSGDPPPAVTDTVDGALPFRVTVDGAT